MIQPARGNRIQESRLTNRISLLAVAVILAWTMSGCDIKINLGPRQVDLAVGPTHTAQPTYTTNPTYTPRPTFTALPTYTPRPTYTFLPTMTP